MSGFAMLVSRCPSCGATFECNPVRVPSLRVNGEKTAICRSCFELWNMIHRTSKGLPPEPLAEDAYTACKEDEL